MTLSDSPLPLENSFEHHRTHPASPTRRSPKSGALLPQCSGTYRVRAHSRCVRSWWRRLLHTRTRRAEESQSNSSTRPMLSVSCAKRSCEIKECQVKKLLLLLPALLAFIGSVQSNPNPLTFWWYAGDPAILRPAIECALERIRAATCLPVDVSIDAHHWVRQKALSGMVGQTTGTSWYSTRIAILDTVDDEDYACNIVTHEIAQHVLRRQNDHAGGYSNANKYRLYEQVVTDICAVQSCACFNPEL
jgi:hypothetical protein